MMMTYKVKVNEIITGDTFKGDIVLEPFGIVIEDQTFRLFGVEAPRKRDKKYYEAIEYLASLIEDEEEIYCDFHKQDSKGRWLVTVIRIGDLYTVNELMLAKKLVKKFKKRNMG
jgi:endonuclease YncB( thermonuclease family)